MTTLPVSSPPVSLQARITNYAKELARYEADKTDEQKRVVNSVGRELLLDVAKRGVPTDVDFPSLVKRAAASQSMREDYLSNALKEIGISSDLSDFVHSEIDRTRFTDSPLQAYAIFKLMQKSLREISPPASTDSAAPTPRPLSDVLRDRANESQEKLVILGNFRNSAILDDEFFENALAATGIDFSILGRERAKEYLEELAGSWSQEVTFCSSYVAAADEIEKLLRLKLPDDINKYSPEDSRAAFFQAQHRNDASEVTRLLENETVRGHIVDGLSDGKDLDRLLSVARMPMQAEMGKMLSREQIQRLEELVRTAKNPEQIDRELARLTDELNNHVERKRLHVTDAKRRELRERAPQLIEPIDSFNALCAENQRAEHADSMELFGLIRGGASIEYLLLRFALNMNDRMERRLREMIAEQTIQDAFRKHGTDVENKFKPIRQELETLHSKVEADKEALRQVRTKSKEYHANVDRLTEIPRDRARLNADGDMDPEDRKTQLTALTDEKRSLENHRQPKLISDVIDLVSRTYNIRERDETVRERALTPIIERIEEREQKIKSHEKLIDREKAFTLKEFGMRAEEQVAMTNKINFAASMFKQMLELTSNLLKVYFDTLQTIRHNGRG